MADITVTPADVAKVDGSQQTKLTGVAITAGESVYVDVNGVLQLAADTSAIVAAAAGIALCDAAAGQPCTYQVSGNLDVGATLAIGEVYCVGAAAGGIAPCADPGSGDFVTVLGVATAADNLKVGINASGVAHA